MVAMMMVRMVIVLRCRPAGYLGRPGECLIRHHGCDALRLAYVSFVVAGLLILIKYSEKEIVWHSCDENGIDCYINEIFLFSIMVFFWFNNMIGLPPHPSTRKAMFQTPARRTMCRSFTNCVESSCRYILQKYRLPSNLTAGVCEFTITIFMTDCKSWESYISRFCDNVTEL